MHVDRIGTYMYYVWCHILVLGLSYDIVLQIGPYCKYSIIHVCVYDSTGVFAGGIQIFCMVGG